MSSLETSIEEAVHAVASALSALLLVAGEAGAHIAFKQLPAHAKVDNNVEVLTTREAAALLRISVSTLHRSGAPMHYVGCAPRYLRSELLGWVANR